MPDFIYKFDPIANRGSGVVRHDCGLGTKKRFQIGVEDDFRRQPSGAMPPIAADMIDLAVAVWEADRLTPNRHLSPVAIHIELPVRLPDLFKRQDVIARLTTLLDWYTEDQWSFDFTQRSDGGRKAERQQVLQFPRSTDIEVALWSGGVDAAVGLISRIVAGGPERAFMLVGTSANSTVGSVQHNLVNKLQEKAAQWNLKPAQFDPALAPIYPYGTASIRRNRMTRARGFAFGLVGAACAISVGSPRLMVYENGIGAINLPWRRAEVGLDHSRGVHPRSLALISDLASYLVNAPFSLELPFIFQTKGEMCSALLEHNAADLVGFTRSCDSPHRKSPSECGYCTSCLLRRAAFKVAGVLDPTSYVVSAPNRRPKQDDLLPWIVMSQQAATLKKCLSTANPWFALGNEFPSLAEVSHILAQSAGMSVGAVRDGLMALYRRHVEEWDYAANYVRPGTGRTALFGSAA